MFAARRPPSSGSINSLGSPCTSCVSCALLCVVISLAFVRPRVFVARSGFILFVVACSPLGKSARCRSLCTGQFCSSASLACLAAFAALSVFYAQFACLCPVRGTRIGVCVCVATGVWNLLHSVAPRSSVSARLNRCRTKKTLTLRVVISCMLLGISPSLFAH